MNYIENFGKYFSGQMTECRRIEHRGNNVLFDVFAGGQRYLLKQYSPYHKDGWDRGGVEFSALKFLESSGIKNIPKAFFYDPENKFGVYSFIDGERLKKIGKGDISKAVDFIVKTHSLNFDERQFGPASAACFCIEDYIKTMDNRFNFLNAAEPTDGIGLKAKSFLEEKVAQKIRELKDKIYSENSKEKLFEKLRHEKQVLTPADFGFHNVLARGDERYYLDFEYFGRDDPARQLLDFYHHASSDDIPEELKKYFIEEYCKRMKVDDEFITRLNLADKLVGMAWVLIYLNPLSEQYRTHMKFSMEDYKEILGERLKKAEEKIRLI